MKSRNLDIQFIKFIYSWVIVIYHLAASTAVTCRGGYCGVEYYLLTAGLFLFLSFERGEETGKQHTPGQYLSRRFWRFIPWSTTAFVLTAAIDRILISPTTSLGAWMDYFARDVWELLLISWNGMNNNALMLNGPAWTLSAMLIVGFFIWTMLYHYKKPFLNLIMPLTLVMGYGYWMHLPSADTNLWIGFTNFGTFRTWLVMCLSYYCLPMARSLAQVRFNRWGKLLLTAGEIAIHCFALAVMVLRGERYYQWLLTLLFMVSIAIAMSGHSYLAKALERSKLVELLGELSMSVYLVHTPVIRLARNLYDMGSWGYRELIPLFAAIAAVAAMHYFLTKWLVGIWRKLWNRARAALTT